MSQALTWGSCLLNLTESSQQSYKVGEGLSVTAVRKLRLRGICDLLKVTEWNSDYNRGLAQKPMFFFFSTKIVPFH